MVLFQLIVPVALVNTLIAMMSNTYQRVEDSKEEHWLLQRASIMQSIIREVGVYKFEENPDNVYWVDIDGARYLTYHHHETGWGREESSVAEDEEVNVNASATAPAPALLGLPNPNGNGNGRTSPPPPLTAM